MLLIGSNTLKQMGASPVTLHYFKVRHVSHISIQMEQNNSHFVLRSFSRQALTVPSL